MRDFLIRRLLALIPTLFFATIIVFFAIRITPGSIIDLMVTQHDISAGGTSRDQIKHSLGLDVPIYIQYGKWVKNIVLHGDLGRSLWKETAVTEEVKNRLPVTFELGIMGLVIAMIIAFPVGIYSAIRQDTAGDYIGRTIAILGLAVPSFAIGTWFMVFPSVWWGWSPRIQYVSLLKDPVANLKMLLIPSIILGASMAAVTMRMTRTMMLEVLRQDYIRTAWAKGLKEMVVVRRHALKNTLIPVITLIGLQLPILIGGTVIIEQIFALPGMGLLLLEAINQRDYPIITGLMLVMGLVTLLINVFVDLSYGYLDPKIRYK